MKSKDKKWKLVKSKTVLESKYVSILLNDYKLPDGKLVKGYYHLSRPDYVLIVAVDGEGKVIVEKNYRRGVDDFVYELPAGWIDEGEKPNEAAERELKEETGYKGISTIVGKIYPQPGFSSMNAYVCLVKIDVDERGEQELGHDEHVDYELVKLRDIEDMVEKGLIKDMGLLAALSLARRKLH